MSLLVLLVLGQTYCFGQTLGNSPTAMRSYTLSANINYEVKTYRQLNEADSHESTSITDSQAHEIGTIFNELLEIAAGGIRQKTAQRVARADNEQRGEQNVDEVAVATSDLMDNDIFTATAEQEKLALATSTSVPPIPLTHAKTFSTPLSDHYKVVCYIGIRQLKGYLAENIDHTFCTHIIITGAILDTTELIIREDLWWERLANYCLKHLETYRGRGVKVLLAVGGWEDSQGNKYSRLVASQVSRSKFVTHALGLIVKYGFDGLEVDWEWPVCWQCDCGAGPATDKGGFSLLLVELSSAFRPKGLLLTTKVGQLEEYIDHGYHIPLLVKYVDWITPVTYYYYGPSTGKTIHGAPLYNVGHHKESLDSTVNYLISKGAPSRKIVLGLPFYGKSFTINNPETGVGLNVPASAGNAGNFTRSAGTLAYCEICDRIHNHSWTVVHDPLRRMGPYAYKGNQWVAFDDADMVRQKAQYIKNMNLGGGMVKALHHDDFKGECGEGIHPLLHALQQVLADPPNAQNTSVPASTTDEILAQDINPLY